jgi:hypothetical protein
LSVAFPAGLANAEPVGEGAFKFDNGVVWHLLAFVGNFGKRPAGFPRVELPGPPAEQLDEHYTIGLAFAPTDIVNFLASWLRGRPVASAVFQN